MFVLTINMFKKASTEWIAQRVSAVIGAVFLLSILFYLCFIRISKLDIKAAGSHISALFNAILSPYAASFFIIGFSAIMYHGAIGMKIIFEDYIKNKKIRSVMIFCSFLFAFFVSAVVAFTIVTMYVKYSLLRGK